MCLLSPLQNQALKIRTKQAITNQNKQLKKVKNIQKKKHKKAYGYPNNIPKIIKFKTIIYKQMTSKAKKNIHTEQYETKHLQI